MWTDLLELEPVENVIETARLLDGVGLDVVLSDDVGDSGMEVVEPVYDQVGQDDEGDYQQKRVGRGGYQVCCLTNLGHRG